MKKISIVYIVALVALWSCTEKTIQKPTTTESEKPVVAVNVPLFDADSAYLYVKKQVDFGPRVPNTPAHEACKSWLVAEFKKYNFSVIEQPFQWQAYDKNNLQLTNIIAQLNPENTKRILIAAHWDSRHIADNDTENKNKPIDGANDGASGVGIILELARLFARQNPNVGVDFILFDGEDYGQPEESDFPAMPDSWCFGSQYWSKNKHIKNYYADYGILLDMVGAKGAKFAKEGASRYYANNVVEKIWNTAMQIGYSDVFIMRNSPQIIDDHVYVNQLAQIPMADIIEYNTEAQSSSYFGPYHHTHKDNMEIIDKNTLKAVGQTVAHIIYNEK